MTISSSQRSAGPFLGNGAQTAFQFSFKVFTAADVVVLQRDPALAELTLELSADYTVTLNGDQNVNPGGVVTLLAPLASGYRLDITREVSPLQLARLTNAGGFFPQTIEDGLDRVTILAQQSADPRAIKFPEFGSDQYLPALSSRVNSFLGFDSDGALVPISLDYDANAVQLALDLVGATGSQLVGWKQSGAGAVTRTLDAKAREWVSVNDFGARGNGSTDDTVSIQAAITYCISSGAHLIFAPGVYRVSALTIGASENFKMDLGGATLKSNGVSANPLITVKNNRGTHISNGVLDGNFSLTQSVLLKVFADNGSGCSYGVFTGIRFRNAQLGIQLGDPARPDEPYVSEHMAVGCNFIGCLTVIKAYGVQGEFNFVGGQLTPGTNGWTSFPGSYEQNAIVSIGANVRVTGGEITSYSSTSAAIVIRPIASGSGNLYGKVMLVGSWIEVQEQIARAENPASVASPVGGIISIMQCIGGLLGNTVAAIDTAVDFIGEIRVLNSYLWANGRSFPNINTPAAATITVDSVSFHPLANTVGPGAGYLAGAAGFTGGVLNYLSGWDRVGGTIDAGASTPDHVFDTRVARGTGTRNVEFRNDGGMIGYLDNAGIFVAKEGLYAGTAGIKPIYGKLFSPSANNGAMQLANSIWQGTGAPSNSVGAVGDVYFRADTPSTSNQRMYIKTGASVWTAIL